MDINPNNFIAVNEVLADVLVILADEDNSHLTPGYYISQVKNSLDELGFDIPFLPVTTDVKMPEDLMVDIPIGSFNMQSIVIYKGTPDAVGYTEDLYWRKGVQTRGKETGVTSSVNSYNSSDPFFRCNVWENSLYYFSIQNGLIRLSDACQNYDYVRMTYAGLPSVHLDKVKMIPPECRKAILDWVVVRCAGSLKFRDARYRIIESDAKRDLDEYGFNGSWAEAKQRLLRLDKKKLRDVILYNAKLNY
jgi:hypothetical protein